MEQSKLISGMILKLKVAYPYFFKDLEDEEFVALTKMYQEQIIGYTPEIVLKAIDEIIRTSKFMPSIAEILDKCDSSAKTYSYDILEKMKNDGYDVISGPRTTGDGYYESCIIGMEGNQIEITV